MNILGNVKIFWKYFLVLFSISFFLINWVDFGWMFNYRIITGTASEIIDNNFSKPEEERTGNLVSKTEVILDSILELEPESKSEPSQEQSSPKTERKQMKAIEKENAIEIEKIGVLAPVIFFDDIVDDEVVHEALDRGTVHFPGSALPGETGQTIILGHSAPPGWPDIKYDWVFTYLDDLVFGDKISVYLNGQKYVYYVKDKIFIDKGDDLPGNSTDGNALALISCWPPGKNYRRIVVIGRP
jgi:LPXTG-site transpeptidase (sortase) family protein